MSAGDRQGASRFLAFLVFVVVSAVAVGGFVITRDAADREEDRLLRDRTAEVAALLSTANSVSQSLDLVGDVYASRNEAGRAFTAGARSLMVGSVTTVGVARIDGGNVAVLAVEGSGATVGAPLGEAREALVRLSLEREGLVSTLLPGDGSRTLVLALGRDDGLVVFEETVVSSSPVPASPTSPFRELNAVLYRSATPDPTNLLLSTTAELPLRGPTATQEVTFGSEKWLLQTSTASPLASSQARAVPWIILGTGFAAALLAGSVVLFVTRRRGYTLNLVEQRTADLRHAMAELEEARAIARRREQGEEPVPVADEPRAAHAVERGARVRAAPRAERPVGR